MGRPCAQSNKWVDRRMRDWKVDVPARYYLEVGPTLGDQSMRSELIDLGRPRIFESDPITPTATETTILVASGGYSACDVSFFLPASWKPPVGVTLRLYQIVGQARILLRSVAIGEVPLTDSPTATTSGVAFQVRGRPSTMFELTLVQTGGSGVSGGRFYMSVWNDVAGPTSGDALGSLNVRGVRDELAYSAATGVVQSTTPAGSTGALASLFKLNSGLQRRIEIQRIVVSYFGGNTTATQFISLRGARISTNPTGNGAGASHEPSDPNSTGLFRSGGTATGTADMLSLVVKGDDRNYFEWRANDWGKPIVLRAGSTEGFEVRWVVGGVALSTAMSLSCSFHWVEI